MKEKKNNHNNNNGTSHATSFCRNYFVCQRNAAASPATRFPRDGVAAAHNGAGASQAPGKE